MQGCTLIVCDDGTCFVECGPADTMVQRQEAIGTLSGEWVVGKDYEKTTKQGVMSKSHPTMQHTQDFLVIHQMLAL